jgi:hypothetical protein
MASREKDKAPANLLRGSLRDSGDACPEPGILAAYFERSLDADETARYELHFSQCARCREELAAMCRASEPAPAGGAESRQASRRAWLWDWRALAPVAAVLILAAVWLARRPASNKVAELKSQPPLVAMSQPSEAPAASVPAPIPEQYSASSAKPPSKALIAPAGGAVGAIGQPQPAQRSRALDDKEEFATNLPLEARNEGRSDELAKDAKALKRDSADTDNALEKQASTSQAAAPSAPEAAPSPPPASVSASALGGNAERITVSTEEDAVAPKTAATKTKPTGAPAGMRTLTQQAQTQTVVQSQALALEAVDRRSTGSIVTTPDPKIQWRIAEGGFVERSTDGGASWQGQLPDANAQLTAGSAPSAKICWLVGRDGVILLTKDAKHWKTIPPPVTADFVGVAALDASSATVTAADGRKFTTADGGKHWNPAP